MQVPVQEQTIQSRDVKIADLPLALGALQRQLTTFLSRYRVDLSAVRQISDGYLIGPITHPAIKRQLNDLKAKGRHGHLVSVLPVNSLGTCLVIIDVQVYANARLQDFPPIYVAVAHYSQVPEMVEYLQREIIGPRVERRFGKEDLETHFRLFTGAIGLKETPPDDLRVAGYYDKSYGYMVEMYADPVERTIDYLNLGPQHLIEGGHCSYTLGPDVFALISFRKTLYVGSRLMAIAWCRSGGHRSAVRDLDRWQRSYDKC